MGIIAESGPTIVGILVGSAFTLLGVWATNRANQENLRTQLDHDRASRAKEHALGLRKEIYLSVSETLAEGLRSIINLNDLSRSSVEIIEPYSSRSASMARIHVIAEEETAILFADFVSSIDQAFVELRLARQAAEILRGDVMYYTGLRDRHAKARDRIFEIFSEERVNGPIPAERLNFMDSALKQESELENRYEKKRAELAALLLPMHHEFTQKCFAEHDRVVQTALPLIAAVRDELELPIDQVKYAQVLQPRSHYAENLSRLFGITKKDQVDASGDASHQGPG